MTTTGGTGRRLVRRAVALSCATTLMGASAALLLGGPAHADDEQTNDNRYSLSAQADGMYFTLYDGSLPATPNVDASPYSAQVSVNSQGASTGFAGLPYLGKTAETLPGTVNGLAGGNFPPVPAAPGYVATTYPGHKSESQSQGPYLVSSDGLSFGPLDALNVSSDLTMTSDGKGDPKVVQKDNLGSFTALGFKVGITNEGFTVLGANLPLPTKTILDNLNKALGAQGLQIEVLPGSTSKDEATGATTVTSGSVKITNSRDLPVEGPTLVTYTFARSVVSTVNVASATVTDPTGSTGSDTTSGSDSTGGSTGTTGSTGSDPSGGSGGVALNPGTVGVVPPPATGDTAPPPTLDTSSGDLTGTTSGGGGTGTTVTPRKLGFLPATAPKGTETRSLYLVLVLAGAGVLGGQQLFRHLGVRLMLRNT